jgi:uncharacterized protein involved in exopolysaccharide biosynthesis
MISHARPEPSSSLSRAVRRHFGKVVAACVVCVGAAAAYTALAPIYYGSEAKIYVRLGHESVALDPTATTTGQTVSVQDLRETELNSVFETLTSRMILEGVVDELGAPFVLGTNDPLQPPRHDPDLLDKLNPWTTYSSRDEAIQTLAKRLSVTNAKKSDVITIFCEGQTPESARAIVQKVIDLTRDSHTRVNRIAGSLDFFTEQTAAERKRLIGLEDQLRELKDRSGVSSLDQQREIRLKQVGDLESELNKSNRVNPASDAQRQVLQARFGQQAPMVVTSETTGQVMTAPSRMREQLYALQIKQHEMESNLTDAHPLMVVARAQIAQAQATLNREVSAPQVIKGENKTYKDLELALVNNEASAASLHSEQEALTRQLADSRRSLKDINGAERQLVELEREIDLSRAKYRRYADNSEQARIEQALAAQRISNINVLQQPTFSFTPVRPRTVFNLSIGLGLGLISAAALVALGESRRHSKGSSNGFAHMENGQSDDGNSFRRIVYQAQ